MLRSNRKIIRHKVGLLNLAEELGNVSKACQMMGLSRDTFYRYRDEPTKRLKSCCAVGLLRPTPMQPQPLFRSLANPIFENFIELPHQDRTLGMPVGRIHV